MGCYAAVHALKLAHALAAVPGSKILIVCTELCTLHFQQEPTLDNMLSSLLFSDGAAAALVVSDEAIASGETGLRLKGFYSEIVPEGKSAMTWGLSSRGFQMTLTGYVTDLIRADFATLVQHALENNGISRKHIGAWCIHPGGKRILDAIGSSLSFTNGELDASYAVLRQYGNMSSPTILFVLRQLMEKAVQRPPNCIFGAAFGPGLTMETFVAEPTLL
jgi:predicted naringenin-chalcone synthase